MFTETLQTYKKRFYLYNLQGLCQRNWVEIGLNGLSQIGIEESNRDYYSIDGILSTNTKSEMTNYSNMYKTQIVYLNFNSLQPIKV